MKKKILWISKEDPHELVRPNESGITKLDITARKVHDGELSIATNFRELKDVLSINKDNWFSEICFVNGKIDELHDTYDCISEVYNFETDNLLPPALYTFIDCSDDERSEFSLFIDHLIDITSEEQYL